LLGLYRGLGRNVWIWLRPVTDAPLSAARRDLSRSTRLRWLACGRHADWQWDVFIPFNGGSLPRPSRRREESWPRSLPLLEQLTAELALASAEGTLPETLHSHQVWVGPEGHFQLIDIPLHQSDGDAASGPHRALALLADVAALVLEGQPRATRETGPVRAPISLHARPYLDRLLGGGKPYRDVAEAHTALQALADESAEVTAHRRATQLAMQAALLFLGMGCCMLPASWYNQFFPSVAFVDRIHEKEQRLADLEQEALLDFAVGAFNPTPQVRLQAAVQLEADYQLCDRLRQSLDHDRRQHAARLETSSWISRRGLAQIEKQASAELKKKEMEGVGKHPELFGPGHFRNRAQRLVDSRSSDLEEMPSAGFWLTTLVAWPALWVVWAFLARGGISYRLAGIALVRGDGRPASRLQCAGRALLTWAPLTGLLVLSFWLEERYWSMWRPDVSPRWLFALATAIWYASLLLLAGYVLLALWRPARTVHDRLSGVYLVPR
jgi:eukaryotic-like serine/threonine-protein kinase